jgi:hypothetical protein
MDLFLWPEGMRKYKVQENTNEPVDYQRILKVNLECFRIPYRLCQKVKAFTLQSFIKHNHHAQIRDIFPLSGNSTDNFQSNRRQHPILAFFLLFDEMARIERCVRVRQFPHSDFPCLCLQSRIRNLVLLVTPTAAQQMALQTYP